MRRMAIILRLSVAGLTTLALGGLIFQLSQLPKPYSTPIEFEWDPSFEPAARSQLEGLDRNESALRLAFVGDIMQHREQAGDDFGAAYAEVVEMLESYDLAIGNLEFPVDRDLPIGPPPFSARFNGSPAHLKALAASGLDLLSCANNHSFDQGLEGALETRDALRSVGLDCFGTGKDASDLKPKVVDVNGISIAIAGYTIRPNIYTDADGKPEPWSRRWPLNELNFADWSLEYREEGQELFAAHVEAARNEGADFLIAYAHWGKEWHFQPTSSQRLAARDMIDAGFDLVVGSHVHVVNPAELYRGRLIAYGLGNFMAAFQPLETRAAALLHVDLEREADGKIGLGDFGFRPLLIERSENGHRVRPLTRNGEGDDERAAVILSAIVGVEALIWEVEPKP